MDKKNLFMLATGIIIGSCATWKYVSVRERNRADEEIADVKRIYSSKKNQEENSSEDIPEKETYTPIEEDKNHNKEIIEKMNYSSFSKKVEKEKKVERPYIITPEDFGECGYSTVSLTYYADDVLTYEDDDELIDNRDEIVGDDAVNHFGEYEDDSVFVRNDAKKCDYEILYDQRNYHDIYPE